MVGFNCFQEEEQRPEVTLNKCDADIQALIDLD